MRKYDQKFKKEVIRKYLDGQSVASIAREIGVKENTIHRWKSEMIQKDGEPDKEKLLMRKRIIELEMENEILKGSNCLRARKLSRYKFIDSEKLNYPTNLLCRVMQVKRCSYYAYRRGKTYRETRFSYKN